WVDAVLPQQQPQQQLSPSAIRQLAALTPLELRPRFEDDFLEISVESTRIEFGQSLSCTVNGSTPPPPLPSSVFYSVAVHPLAIVGITRVIVSALNLQLHSV
ncbi:unnamed protein product, partial [Laminaria digitata]